jgi:predicted amidophosphoribosyltransferase
MIVPPHVVESLPFPSGISTYPDAGVNSVLTVPLKINPIALRGPWQQGYALDLHTISSTFLGTDSYGHDQFDTKRSEIGELLYRLKYGGDQTTLDPIADTVTEFLRSRNIGIDALIPVPPSNTARQVQPVAEIARKVCERTGIALCDTGVTKVRKTEELKDVFDFEKRATVLANAFAVDRVLTEGKRLLLFDDLYRSGATVTTITNLLTSEGHASAVVLLTLTRTRSKS